MYAYVNCIGYVKPTADDLVNHVHILPLSFRGWQNLSFKSCAQELLAGLRTFERTIN